jgi:Fe-S cluster assembly iron-binding protein IscA
MLTISESAAEVIKVVLAGGDSGQDAGLRIAAVGDSESGQDLQASIAAEPAGEDQVVEESGVRVFLDQQAASVLDDKTLDAERDDNGELGLAVRD